MTTRGATKLPLLFRSRIKTHMLSRIIFAIMHISYGIATCIRISWQCRPQSRGTNPLSLSKIQYSRCGSSTRRLACRQLVPSLESRLGRSSNSYGLLGVGEGVDRTGLARVGEAAQVVHGLRVVLAGSRGSEAAHPPPPSSRCSSHPAG